MERWVAKVICLIGIMFLPFICTLIPYKVHAYFASKGEKGRRILSCLMCFGGGVFFATFMLHMGPEVRLILNEALVVPYHINYPIADFIMSAGFFIVFFLEKVILKCHKKRHANKLRKRNEQCYQFNKVSHSAINRSGSLDEFPNGMLPKDDIHITHVVNGSIHSAGMAVNRDSCPLKGTGDCCNDTDDVRQQMSDSDIITIAVREQEIKDEEISHAHNTRSLVLVVALSLHRIFEGLSLGLQHTTQNVWNLFIAVLCHETVIGFGLGLQFVKNGFSLKKMVIASSLCSIIMPIGVAIGTVLIEIGGSDNGLNMVNGILQGISTGTFIYVTFFEILQEEIDPHDTSLSRFLSVFLGFAVMAALSAVPETSTLLTHPTESFLNMTTAVP